MSKTEQKQVVFYCWVDVDPKENHGVTGIASKMTIQCSVADFHEDPKSGRMACITPHKVARFHQGKVATDDPDVIRTIRALMVGDKNITEDAEVYYAHLLSPADQVKRLKAEGDSIKSVTAAVAEEVAEKDEEIEKLRAEIARLEQGEELGGTDE